MRAAGDSIMQQRATKVVDDGAPITARAKAVKVSDVATADVLVYRKVDVEVRPMQGGGLDVHVQVRDVLRQPVMALIARSA
jgi:hypothetical protein